MRCRLLYEWLRVVLFLGAFGRFSGFALTFIGFFAVVLGGFVLVIGDD